MIDIIPFCTETDLLELRLRELDPIVDRWIVIQSRETHSGKPKPLIFDPQDARWAPWASRMETFIVPPITTQDPWRREQATRHIIPHLLSTVPDDVPVILSDVDEIPSAALLSAWAPELTYDRWVGFSMATFYYYLNLKGRRRSPGIALATSRTVCRWGGQHLRSQRLRTVPVGPIEGGWHFSWQGGTEAIQLKLTSFAHTEYDIPELTDVGHLLSCLQQHTPLFERGSTRFTPCPLSELPLDIQARPAAYAHLLLPEGP
jgi:beta-1,4-mannosyl-glycoprotein beta-1,4-N-acetylglucosaminyltransferase